MLPEYMTHVLAEKTLNTLPEFLNAVDVRLGHSPGPVWGIWRPGLEFLDPFLDAIVD